MLGETAAPGVLLTGVAGGFGLYVPGTILFRKANLITKALDFAQFGGLELTAQVGIGSHYVCPDNKFSHRSRHRPAAAGRGASTRLSYPAEPPIGTY